MYRGTTPTHVFKDLPVSREDIAEIWISYAQNGKEVFTLGDTAATFISDNALEVTLDQEKTLSLSKGRVEIQMRILLTDGTALASDVVSLPVKEILREGRIICVS